MRESMARVFSQRRLEKRVTREDSRKDGANQQRTLDKVDSLPIPTYENHVIPGEVQDPNQIIEASQE